MNEGREMKGCAAPEHVTPVGYNARDDEKPPEDPPFVGVVKRLCRHQGDEHKVYVDIGRDLIEEQRCHVELAKTLAQIIGEMNP